jgi:hypothetical protein
MHGGSLRAYIIAAGLNEAGIPTARGGEWSAVQVQRVMSRPFEASASVEIEVKAFPDQKSLGVTGSVQGLLAMMDL